MTALRHLLELVRAPAALSVPGDVAAGAAAGRALGPRTLGLACSSVCLYWAGMAANDWADRHLDAVERPERPIPSGRVSPGTALGVAAGLTAAGLAAAALAGGRRAMAVAVPLAGAIWAYDLVAKNTRAGPLVMAVCRGLDVLLGATPGPRMGASGPARGAPPQPRMGASLPAALTVAAHTYLLTHLSRGETSGTARHRPAATLAGTLALAATTACQPASKASSRLGKASSRLGEALGHPGEALGHPGQALSRPGQALSRPGQALSRPGQALRHPGEGQYTPLTEATHLAAITRAVLATWYASQFGTEQARAIANPSAHQVRDAVTAGIVSLPALQGALLARAGAPRTGLALAAVIPLARKLAGKLSPT
ncbi:4-hydroxybenzoate polyprenyltransferase [Nonomuraea sp. PA05]|uniref:SCO3242 family prenyltransferase n=1 Tax=Nonomuraea sp. PA05 TaxID=2604466 RepID=UPI0011D371DB|nr:UbiA family prenyltransferase [Nonomuraea sp. PA05]TYB70881.1 4-hydroxybenzoate polyprenyltransferase [Nonomuraea sp. PA05]